MLVQNKKIMKYITKIYNYILLQFIDLTVPWGPYAEQRPKHSYKKRGYITNCQYLLYINTTTDILNL